MKDLLFDQQHTEALLVECEYCGQPVGSPCINPNSGDVLEHQPAHFKRLTAAGKAQVTPVTDVETNVGGGQP